MKFEGINLNQQAQVRSWRVR